MQSNGADGNLLRGTLDFLLLASLEHGPLYGLRIIQDVQQRTGGHFNFKEGTLYPALHRLEKQGFIHGKFQTLPRGGSPVKVYTLTPTGKTELTAQRDKYDRFTRAVRGVIGGPA